MSHKLLLAQLVLATLFLPGLTHGTVSGIVAGGTWYRGYSPQFQWFNPVPVVAGWSIPQDTSNGFVNDYSNPDIICHLGGTPGGAYVKVAAGGTVELQWTPWPTSHLGPVMDYLAPCNGDCSTFDKNVALWTKIDEGGLISATPAYRGTWAVDTLLQNNNSWVVTIPPSIAPGKYVLRHEIIALHEGNRLGGAQNYPQCVNLEITGSGTDNLAGKGTLGTKLYTQQDPGIFFNIYGMYTSYIIPGPRVLGSSNTQPSSISSSSTALTVSTFATSTSKAGGSTQPSNSNAQTTTKATDAISPTGSVLFSGTLTGSGAKPTKFTCYAEL